MFGWKKQKHHEMARRDQAGDTMGGCLITGHSGFISGTCVASNLGWRPVESLCVGDKVLTFDRGMQTIFDIQRETVNTPQDILPAAQRPVLVPAGAMQNRRDLWLMPEQGMLVESDQASDALGDPFAVVPAQSLTGLRGITMVTKADQLDTTTLAFGDDEVIYVEGGMLAYCPRPRCILTDDPEDSGGLYEVLEPRAARILVDCLIGEDNSAPFVCAPEEIAGIAEKKGARPARPLLV